MAKKEKKARGSSYIMVSPQKLRAHPLNHAHFGSNNTRYEVLFESMQINGFLPQYPIVCLKDGNAFVIICGHRRWRIACEQNIPEIPVIIRQDVTTDSVIAEKLMIEDNLCRPLEGREFTYLDRYMFALKLDAINGRKRGGDRRSDNFLQSPALPTEEKKTTLIARMAGMSERYLSMFSVVVRDIMQELERSYTDDLTDKSLYEQIRVAIDNDLSEDLASLAKGEQPIYKLYKKYKKRKTAEPSGPIYKEEGDTDIYFASVVTALLKYIEAKFPGNEAFSEVSNVLSDTPIDSRRQLKLLSRTIRMILDKTKIPKGAKNEKEMELPMFSSTD